ncbi:MAG: c-type cytochrome domain-containing protein, partial [Verrucomicrobiota bacterium]
MNAKESLLLAWLLIASLLATPFSLAEETSAYESLVAPVLEAKCVACHGEEKQKGKLRMDSYAALLEGGSEGPSLVPGSLDDSLMIFRIDLPMDDDEHMPPDSKEQLTKEEIAMLQAWVSKGGTEEMKVADLGLDEAFLATVMKQVAAVAKPKEPTESVAVLPQAVREEAMATVSEMGASLMPIAQDTPQLRYYALNVRDRLSNADLGLLEPVASDMRWLDLGGAANVTDAAMPIVGSMSGLTKLHLQGTSVTDSGLAYLKDLSELTYLNLYGNAKVTDKGLEHLSGLKNLQRLYLWQSGVTPAGAEKLEKAIPGLVINLGWEYEKKKQEEKTPVTAAAAVEKEKNMKKDQPAGGAAASIKEEKKPTPAPEKKPVLPPEKKVV